MPATKLKQTRAYAWSSGRIDFTKKSKIPEGALPIAAGADADIRRIVGAKARLAYDNTTLLVPGVPEASDDMQKVDALKRFVALVQQALNKPV